jgi:hypothetical protein
VDISVVASRAACGFGKAADYKIHKSHPLKSGNRIGFVFAAEYIFTTSQQGTSGYTAYLALLEPHIFPSERVSIRPGELSFERTPVDPITQDIPCAS